MLPSCSVKTLKMLCICRDQNHQRNVNIAYVTFTHVNLDLQKKLNLTNRWCDRQPGCGKVSHEFLRSTVFQITVEYLGVPILMLCFMFLP